MMAELKNNIKSLVDLRGQLMDNLDSVVKPDYMRVESRLNMLENSDERKLDVIICN